MSDVLVLLVQFFASIFVTAWIVRFDIARLPARLKERAWPDSSLWAAVVWFSPLCLLIHFLRTRRSLLGLLLGILWLLAAMLAVSGLAYLAELLSGGAPA
jgi:hypothetical protein